MYRQPHPSIQIKLPQQENEGQVISPMLNDSGQLVLDVTREFINGKVPLIVGFLPTNPMIIGYFMGIYEEFIKLNFTEELANKVTAEIKDKVFNLISKYVGSGLTINPEVIDNVDKLTLVSEIVNLANLSNSPLDLYGLQTTLTDPDKTKSLVEATLKENLYFVTTLKLLIDCKGDVQKGIAERLNKLNDVALATKIVQTMFGGPLMNDLNNHWASMQSQRKFMTGDHVPPQQGYANGSYQNPFKPGSIF